MTSQEVEISMIESMKKRISTRTYKKEELPLFLKEKIRGAFKDNKGPFGGVVRFKLIEKELIQRAEGVKLGTYGVIKGASSYIAAVIPKRDRDLEDFGYVMEKLILKAASLGLGTCWLGGTFNKGEFSQAVGQKEEEILPCITPIGYPAEKRSLLEAAMRLGAGSKHRKPWHEIFYNKDFKQPLTEAEAGEYAIPLEMVRIAPSASNKQPWRIIMDQGKFHFYLQPTKGYSKILGFNVQRVDMGIAMCHFELAAQELGLKGKWLVDNPKPSNKDVNLPPDTKYIVTWEIDNQDQREI